MFESHGIRVSLPSNPPRDNYSYGCETSAADDLPEHLDRCDCETHTGVCQECGYKITASETGIEYGHARARNRAPGPDRQDCSHRPVVCDPGGPRGGQPGGERA